MSGRSVPTSRETIRTDLPGTGTGVATPNFTLNAHGEIVFGTATPLAGITVPPPSFQRGTYQPPHNPVLVPHLPPTVVPRPPVPRPAAVFDPAILPPVRPHPEIAQLRNTTFAGAPQQAALMRLLATYGQTNRSLTLGSLHSLLERHRHELPGLSGSYEGNGELSAGLGALARRQRQTDVYMSRVVNRNGYPRRENYYWIGPNFPYAP